MHNSSRPGALVMPGLPSSMIFQTTSPFLRWSPSHIFGITFNQKVNLPLLLRRFRLRLSVSLSTRGKPFFRVLCCSLLIRPHRSRSHTTLHSTVARHTGQSRSLSLQRPLPWMRSVRHTCLDQHYPSGPNPPRGCSSRRTRIP